MVEGHKVVSDRTDGGALDRCEVEHLKIGRLPNVALSSTLGGTVALHELSGRSVLFVYPWTGRPGLPNPPRWDDIPGAHGSTPQAEGFRDLHARFVEADIAVYGVSGQDTVYQQEFATRLNLPFALLSDADFALQRALVLPVFATGGVTYLKRLTLFVRDGVLARVIYPVTDPTGHAATILGATWD